MQVHSPYPMVAQHLQPTPHSHSAAQATHPHTATPPPTTASFSTTQHTATKRCEWIECPGAEDGSNKGHACEETWKWVLKKKVAVCAYCRLQV
ncbi:hypothetical protein CcaverHIS002_0111080 [Cutaneotrichosporon cavernicola]|uniref:Uncharacterized protein n=1 Tax=Cutaneotrichosporon cavernicola TaxID=279322 RepID=A0AA48I792_9TREE|nr:uncharacterized protein CcaverHIS019_0110980 [Cutaneotrichosporon cavernicola]BEI80579.1 hypothetical protein CcaverHIS002_0111080 [Cutaneotrichosporon cavernicola]BEI88380.1 hypothetical protein CcaverHIS019_0110980 [Cutaneotrichosporon cavernicola]BEI96153.1 hypothetical protein CcaverHIS631_0111020 [Cutaneotrichosporon cavernicola]BEJ03925.1 hypothetical protein CcaverHIS641_0111000 [Cutaneotrichosporon cavernicola]